MLCRWKAFKSWHDIWLISQQVLDHCSQQTFSFAHTNDAKVEEDFAEEIDISPGLLDGPQPE